MMDGPQAEGEETAKITNPPWNMALDGV